MTDTAVRLSPATCTVLAAFAAKPNIERTVTGLAAATGMPAPSVYYVLPRLVDAGWIVRRVEGGTGYYQLAGGAAAAKAAFAAIGTTPRQPARRVAETWTLAELRAAVDRGDETAGFLAAVERRLAGEEDE